MPTRHEKRGTPRVTTVVPVHCRILTVPPSTPSRSSGVGADAEFDAKTINVSRQGLLMNCEVDLWPRTVAEITLTSPVEDRIISLTADVAWSRRNSINLFGRFAAGLKFRKITEKDRLALAAFFKPL